MHHGQLCIAAYFANGRALEPSWRDGIAADPVPLNSIPVALVTVSSTLNTVQLRRSSHVTGDLQKVLKENLLHGTAAAVAYAYPAAPAATGNIHLERTPP